MLSKSARFSRITFPRGAGRRLGFSWGTVALYPGTAFKAAVVVSKKTLPKAHDRNRLRRRLYMALRPFVKKATTTVVVYPRRDALTTPPATLGADLSAALLGPPKGGR